MRRIQRSDFTDIGPPLTSPKGFHGGTRLATGGELDRRRPAELWSGMMGRVLLVVGGMLVGMQGETMVVLRTTMGDITVAVDAEHAPKTAANFLRYVDGGYYEGGRFHRTVR